MTYNQAVESLRRAKETRSPSERNESLRESHRLVSSISCHKMSISPKILSLLLKSTRNLRSGLEEICADYRSLNFPDGMFLFYNHSP